MGFRGGDLSKKNIILIGGVLFAVIIGAVAFFVISLQSALKPGDIIIGIGDSITAGGKTNEEFIADEEAYFNDIGDGYFKIVANSLEEDIGGLTFYNSARSGITSLGFVSLVNPYCLDYDPDLVIISLGVNDFLFDTPEALREGFFHVTDAIHKKEVNTVVILPFVMEHYLDYGHLEHSPLPENMADHYDVVVEISEGYGFETVDIGAIFDEYIENGTDPRDLSEDGIHPTDWGKEILAQAVLEAIDNF